MLNRSIGTWGMLFAAVGGIIGSGWLFGPFYAAQSAGPASILSWILGGFLMMVVALTFAELGSTFPMAGGTVRFLHLSHGALVSFTMAWIGWLSTAAIAPIETMALLQYAENYMPGLAHRVDHQYMLTHLGIMIAALLMLIMCFINILGARILAKTNSIVVIIKVAIPVLTIIFLFSKDYHVSNFTAQGFVPLGWKNVLMALPSAGIIFSFIGYSPAIQLAGEAKNPQRSVPIAIIGALLIGIVLYVSSQIAFIGALPLSSFSGGWALLSFKHDAGPIAGLVSTLGFFWLVKILYLDALIAPFGTALIYTASSARIVYAMGDNGYLPSFLKKLNRFNVPARIIALNYGVGMLLFLPFPTWQKMAGFLVSCLVFSYAVGPLALLVLRKIMPDQPRPFKVPMPRLVGLFAFYICNLLVFWASWAIVSNMLCAILLGYAVLFLYRLTKSGRKIALEWKKGWWILLYVSSLGVLSYLGSFGGRGYLSFGWDFVAIALMTLVIYEIAIYSGIYAKFSRLQPHVEHGL